MSLETHTLYNGKITLTFDESKHVYRVNGEVVNGVTTMLGVLDKPMLIPWAVKETVKEMGYYEKQTWTPAGYVTRPEEEQAVGNTRLKAILEHFKVMTPDEYWQMLHNAKGSYRNKRDEAANIGTMVHQWIEDYIKGKNPATPEIEKVKNGVEAFMEWTVDNDVKFILSEQKIYSKKFKFAGTLDWTAIVNGVPTMGDIKTSNFFNPEMFWQVSAYQHARLEEYPKEKYDQQIIIRCDKNNGKLETFTSRDYEENIKAFAACAVIHRKKKGTAEIKHD